MALRGILYFGEVMHGVALAAHKFWMTLTGRKKGTESHGIHRFFGVLVYFPFCLFLLDILP